MLEALGVSRRYGWRWALRDLDLTLFPGETVALLGKNGSGKTTLIKTLAGLLRPTKGEVRMAGKPISRVAKKRIGLLSHEPMLYEGLTIRENLRYFARLYGVENADISGRVESLAKMLGIPERLDEPVRILSQGLRQRAALARALLHEPEIVLLDEPFSGLDPEAAERLGNVVRALGERGERIVVFTTHDLSKAFGIGDRIVVLAEGRIAYAENAANSREEEIMAAFDASPGDA